MKTWINKHTAALLFIAMALLFRLLPEIDLVVTGWFYRPDEGFIFDDNFLVQLSYKLFAKLHFLALITLAWLLFASGYWQRDAERGLRKRLWFLLLVLLLGPGLMVSTLKDNMGRARPSEITQFGGDKRYTAALEPAKQCDRNCAFVSGHAAMGFWFIALAWVFRDRRWLWFGIGLGGLVGLGRIMQGSHYLSDVVFSYWVVYASCVLLAHWILNMRSIKDNEVPRSIPRIEKYKP